MTENGKRCLRVMRVLEKKSKNGDYWFTAQRITKHYERQFGEVGETSRSKPIMTISGYLTHLKRAGLVERQVSTDKIFAWWRLTKRGREMIDAA